MPKVGGAKFSSSIKRKLIGAYFLTTKSDKRMRLLTRLCGIWVSGKGGLGQTQILMLTWTRTPAKLIRDKERVIFLSMSGCFAED